MMPNAPETIERITAEREQYRAKLEQAEKRIALLERAIEKLVCRLKAAKAK